MGYHDNGSKFNRLTTISESDIILNNKQHKTLEKIFEDPLRSDVPWSDVESLFIALGADVSEGRGSRVDVLLNDVVAVFHRPHPERVTDKGALKSVRRFLTNAGVRLEK
jgi:hypothetical protein